MFLKGTSDLLRLNIATASNIKVKVWWGDALDGAPPAASDFDTVTFAAQTGTGDVTLLAGVAGHTRKPQASVFNTHATQATVVYLDMTDGTNAAEVAGSKVNLLAGESLLMLANETCLHYDSNGGLYPSVGNAASVAEMEAGAALDKYVAPGTQHWHPGHPKCWGVVTVSAGTPTLAANYNLTSITDTATGDIVFTVATDFSSVNWCCQHSVEIITGAFAVATVRDSHVKFGTLAAGTVSLQCIDKTTTTNLLKDPQSWHMVGLGDQA